MNVRLLTVAAAFGAMALSLQAQPQVFQRRAAITGGGDRDRGKCTIEVVVDGAAEVTVRGDTATLRNLSGQLPQWRRFECTSPMPLNPVDFRFQGIDGRGRQDLVSDPRSGGPVVVRIEDRDNGQEGYTFDLTWGGGYPGGGYPGGAVGREQYPGGPGGYPDRTREPGYRGGDRRFTVDQAVQVCQDAVRQQVANRYGADIRFRNTAIDDQPGRRDYVVGSFDVRGRRGRDEDHSFSCSVNFDTGRVRTVRLDRGPEVRIR